MERSIPFDNAIEVFAFLFAKPWVRIDILKDIIIGVAAFESVITAIAPKTGRNSTWVLITEFLVVLVATAAIFSTAMAWFRTEARFRQLEIYLQLVFFISTGVPGFSKHHKKRLIKVNARIRSWKVNSD